MKVELNLVKRIILLLLMGYIVSACGLFTDQPGERAEENNQAIAQGAEFSEVVMAESIGANNEPIGVNDNFNTYQDVIYVVAEADYIKSGTTMFARWSREGQPFEDSSTITANQDYEDTYVEFHLENLSEQMEPGEYSVQLFVNGNPAEIVYFSVE